MCSRYTEFLQVHEILPVNSPSGNIRITSKNITNLTVKLINLYPIQNTIGNTHKIIYLENYFKNCFIQTWAKLSTEMSKYILPRSLLILHDDFNFSLTSSAAACSKPVGTVAPIVTRRCSDSLLGTLSVTCVSLWFSWRFTCKSWLVASWISDMLAVLPRFFKNSREKKKIVSKHYHLMYQL